MTQAAHGLDMLRLREIPQRQPGVLAFLMARPDGPATVVSRPPLECYLIGIGLNVATIRIEADGRTLRRGTYGLHGVHLVQPHQQADYGFSGKLVNLRLRLSMQAVADAINERGGAAASTELADTREHADRILGDLARRLLRAALAEHPDTLRVDSLMQCLVDRVVRTHATGAIRSAGRETLSPKLRGRALDFMRAHYMDDVSLTQISAAVGLSRAHFLRAFRNDVGLPPHAFLTLYRLHRAGELLRRTRRSATDIAAATGFCNHAHMTSTFRRWVGFTPAELRAPQAHGLRAEAALLFP